MNLCDIWHFFNNRIHLQESCQLSAETKIMGLLSGMISNHVFNLLLSELESHEPQVQEALLSLATKIIEEVKAKIESHLNTAKIAKTDVPQ